jgi:hypothetical protein
LLLAAFFVFALCSPLLALKGAEVAKDFQPVSGYVVAPMQGEFLIDLDASQGVAAGDLFAVIQAGEKIVHPVTKKVVGAVEKAKAYLQVTRVQPGYSYTRVVGMIDGAQIQAGDAVRRYQNLPARFWDYSGRGEGLFAELKTSLPHLEWGEYASDQRFRPAAPAPSADQLVGLTFIYDGSRLEVRDPYFQVIRNYGSASSPGIGMAAAPAASGSAMRLQPLTGAPSAPGYAMQPRPGFPQAAPMASAVPYKLDEKPISSYGSGGGVRYEAAFPGFKHIGDLPPGIIFSDFVVENGRRLMAAVNGTYLFVYDLSGGLQRVAQANLPYTVDLLAVRWWKPSPSEPLHLAVTGWIQKEGGGETLASAVFALEKNELRLVEDNIRYILGSLDRDGDGLPEILLAQDYNKLKFFGTRFHRLTLDGGKLKEGDAGIPLPSDLAVVSGRYVDITGSGQPQLAFVRNNILYIYSSDGQSRLWESNKQMGGSLAQAMHLIQRSDVRQTGLSDVTALELPPVAADLDGDHLPELLVPSMEKIAFGVAEGAISGVKKSWLGVIKFRDGMFVKGTIGEEMETPLAGLTITNQEVLFVATETPSFLGKKGTCYLLSFPLK